MSAPMYVDKPVPIPESLIKHPCQVVGAGKTVKSLSRGYTKNTSCVGEYKAVVEGIEVYNNKLKTSQEKVDDK